MLSNLLANHMSKHSCILLGKYLQKEDIKILFLKQMYDVFFKLLSIFGPCFADLIFRR